MSKQYAVWANVRQAAGAHGAINPATRAAREHDLNEVLVVCALAG